MQVTEVRKSQSFSNEKPFAVVRFKKSVKGSKFAAGSLNDGNSYSLTYNLSLIYPEIKDDDGQFDEKEAWKTFKNEMQIGMEEPVNGYDVPISEISDLKAVIIKSTKRRMEVMRPACYGTRDDAIRIAKASLERQLKDKSFVPADDAEEDEEE
jgi:hypothetical protein